MARMKPDPLGHACGLRLLSGASHQPRLLSAERTTAIVLTIVSCVAVALLFSSVIRTLIDAWSQSRTFAHGFLVVPGSLYLAWCFRHRISDPSPESWGWIMVVLPGGAWLVGYFLQNLLVQQASVIAMFPCLIYAIWGKTIFQRLLLPLGFLGFALPVGTALEPWLQDLTTTFLSAGLRASGIPFDREGYFITLPSGVWEVAPDCGGLRYLLPGLALGYLYAAVMYRRPLSRLCFLALCALLLILANGVRAYGIIVSDYLRIADGTDHRVFSYSIYTVTIVILAWLGRRWSSAGPDIVPEDRQFGRPHGGTRATVNAVCAVALLTVVSVAQWSEEVPAQSERASAPQISAVDRPKTAAPLYVHAP